MPRLPPEPRLKPLPLLLSSQPPNRLPLLSLLPHQRLSLRPQNLNRQPQRPPNQRPLPRTPTNNDFRPTFSWL